MSAGASRKLDGVYGWYLLAVLFLAYVLAFLDRQILSLLVEPMKQALRLSDTEISLLQGLAFALCNGVAGLPLGRLVDTRSRVRVATAGVACWSFMTACCGVARRFPTLFLSRMGVGIGEAALTPAAYSIITDSVPPGRLGLALALFTVGVQVGSGTAFVGGASVITLAAHAASWGNLPLIGRLSPWQAVFFIVGLPGLPLALWMMRLREPLRKEIPQAVRNMQPLGPESQGKVLRFLAASWSSLGPLYLCMAFAAMASYALNTWAVSLLARTFGWGIAESGHAFGMIVIVLGALGVLTGGAAGDALIARGNQHGRVSVMMTAAIAAAPCALAACLAPTATAALAWLAPMVFFNTVVIGVGPSALQERVPNRMRGIATSVGVLIVNLMGLGIGPTAVALATDDLFRNEQQLRYSLALLLPCMLALSAAFGAAGLGSRRRPATERHPV